MASPGELTYEGFKRQELVLYPSRERDMGRTVLAVGQTAEVPMWLEDGSKDVLSLDDFVDFKLTVSRGGVDKEYPSWVAAPRLIRVGEPTEGMLVFYPEADTYAAAGLYHHTLIAYSRDFRTHKC